jgi:hypothetical protein
MRPRLAPWLFLFSFLFLLAIAMSEKLYSMLRYIHGHSL